MRSAGRRRSRARWVPNALSIGRLLCLPILLWAFSRVEATPGPSAGAARGGAIALIVVLALTDRLDGYLARRLEAVSGFGSALDAVADKSVQFVPLFYLALTGSTAFSAVPLWLPCALLGLDSLLILWWAALHLTRGRPLPAAHNRAGHVTGLLLFALLVWVAADLPASGVAVGGAAALASSSVSAAGYAREWWRAG